MRKTIGRGPLTFINTRIDWLWRWFYRCGFDLQDDCELQPGWSRASWAAPAWAASDGIIGEWKIVRSRIAWFGIPLTAWRDR